MVDLNKQSIWQKVPTKLPPSLYQYRREVLQAVIASVVFIVLTIIAGCFIFSLDQRNTFYIYNGGTTDLRNVSLQSGCEAVDGGILKAHQSTLLRADLRSPSELSISFKDKQGRFVKNSMQYQKRSRFGESVAVNMSDDGEVAWQILGD
jgi:hypothetical protein